MPLSETIWLLPNVGGKSYTCNFNVLLTTNVITMTSPMNFMGVETKEDAQFDKIEQNTTWNQT